MGSTEKQLISIPEACDALGGIGVTTVYELIKRRELVKVNIGRRGFITADSLDAYVARLSAAAVATA
jgi:excisionase family DNA binding protein